MKAAFTRLAPRGTPWTLEELMEVGRRFGRKPTLTDVIPHQGAIKRLCGGLSEYQAMLGYEPNGQGRPRKEGT